MRRRVSGVVRYGPSLQLPTRYRDAEGVERIAGRRPAMHLNGKVYCPNRHRIRDTLIQLQEHVYRCPQQMEDRNPCGVLLYVLAGLKATDGSDLMWAVEVTHQEIDQMRAMTIAEKLVYLEQTWAGLD
jgi:hypothetical protein